MSDLQRIQPVRLVIVPIESPPPLQDDGLSESVLIGSERDFATGKKTWRPTLGSLQGNKKPATLPE